MPLAFLTCTVAATNAGLSVGDDDVVAGAVAAAATARAAAAMAEKGNWVLLGLLVVALPLSLHRSLGSLAFVTSASLGSMVVLTIAVAVRGGGHAATHWDSLEYRWWPREGDAAAAVLRSLPIFTLSYMCHFNALSMHAELMNPTRARLKAVIAVTLGVSTAMYIVFGVFGYLWAGDGTQGDVLAAFPANDTFINIGRVKEQGCECGINLHLNFSLYTAPFNHRCYVRWLLLFQHGVRWASASPCSATSPCVSCPCGKFCTKFSKIRAGGVARLE